MHAEALLRFDIGVYRQIAPEAVAGRVSDADVVIFVGGISPDLEGEDKYLSTAPVSVVVTVRRSSCRKYNVTS